MRSRAAGSAEHQPQLDGLRAVAVLTIIVFHATSWLPGGYIGVDLFFVLSGFLITRILLREVAARGTVSFGRFYARRALRLLPALGVLCAVVAPLFVLLPGVDQSASLLGTAGALTYTASPLAASGHDLGLMVHTWSLSVEELFYLVWPLALVLVATRRHRLAVLVAVTSLAVGYRILVGAVSGWPVERIAYASDTRAEQLLIGACAALLLGQRPVRLAASSVLVAALVLPAMAVAPSGPGGDFYVRYGGSTVVALASAVLLLGVVSDRSRLLTRVLTVPPLIWVGQRSYGIYLWNLPIVGIVAATPVPGPLQMPVKLVLTFLLPALSYRYVEQPFLRRKERYASEVPPADGGPAVRRNVEALPKVR